MTKLLPILLLTTISFGVAIRPHPEVSLFETDPAPPKSVQPRQCNVSIFPVTIFNGNECPYQYVMTGIDTASDKVACGRVTVSCP